MVWRLRQQLTIFLTNSVTNIFAFILIMGSGRLSEFSISNDIFIKYLFRLVSFHSNIMAFRTAAGLARRMMSTSAVRSSEMSFTFGGPNAVFYNAASVKQVMSPNRCLVSLDC